MTIRTVRLPESPVTLNTIANNSLVTLRNKGKFNYNTIYMVMGHEIGRNKVELMSVNGKRRRYLTEDATVYPVEDIIKGDALPPIEHVDAPRAPAANNVTTLG